MSSDSVIDEISPSTLAQPNIGLSLAPQRLYVGQAILVDVDFTLVGEVGIVFPLVYTVTQPDGSKLIRELLKLLLPKRLVFQPEVAGRHLVRLGEAFHNLNWGAVEVTILGTE